MPTPSTWPAAGSNRPSDSTSRIRRTRDARRRDVSRHRGAVRGGGRGRGAWLREDASSAHLRAGSSLRHISAGIASRRDELAALIVRESGKSIRDARVEADRAALMFRLAAEEAERMVGETIPLDIAPAHDGRIGHHPAFSGRARWPASAPSTSRSTSRLTRSHRPSRRAARSCSSQPPATPLTMLTVAEIIAEAGSARRRCLRPADVA